MKIDAQDAPPLVTVKTAAAMLGIGRSTVYELIRRGEIETIHIGRSVRIPTTTVERFVKSLHGATLTDRG